MSLRNVSRILALVWSIVMSVLMLLPGNVVDSFMFFPGEDKILHFGVFFLWSGLMTLSLDETINAIIKSVIVLGGAVVFGVSIELLQTFVPNRQADFYDILMNTSGAVAGFIAISYAKKELISVDKKFD